MDFRNKAKSCSFFCSFIFFVHTYVVTYMYAFTFPFIFTNWKWQLTIFKHSCNRKRTKKRGCDKFGRITKACLIGRKQQFLDYNFTYYIVFNLGMEKKSVHSSYKWRLNTLWLLFYVNPWLTALFNVARSCSAAKENSLSLSSMTEEES